MRLFCIPVSRRIGGTVPNPPPTTSAELLLTCLFLLKLLKLFFAISPWRGGDDKNCKPALHLKKYEECDNFPHLRKTVHIIEKG